MKYSFDVIGTVHSPCKQIFAVPRQSCFSPTLTAYIELIPPYSQQDCFTELQQFSHIWLMSVFHRNTNSEWSCKVRPPRLGGKKRVGVFASRSPYRPNPIGLSVHKLEKLEFTGDRCRIHVSGCDLVDGTPVLDIKPYLKYADSIENANSGYIDLIDERQLSVQFSDTANQQCHALQQQYPDIKLLIVELLQHDPRPAQFVGKMNKKFGFRIYDVNIRFQVADETVEVLSLEIDDENKSYPCGELL